MNSYNELLIILYKNNYCHKYYFSRSNQYITIADDTSYK